MDCNGYTMKPEPSNDSESGLDAKLRKADPEIQRFVTALKKENLKLHQKIATLQAEGVSLNSQIQVIEKTFADYTLHNPECEVSEEQREELSKFAAAYLKDKYEKT
jgi:predicted RNase H-like nuclease (RuvC/YqgF family)